MEFTAHLAMDFKCKLSYGFMEREMEKGDKPTIVCIPKVKELYYNKRLKKKYIIFYNQIHVVDTCTRT